MLGIAESCRKQEALLKSSTAVAVLLVITITLGGGLLLRYALAKPAFTVPEGANPRGISAPDPNSGLRALPTRAPMGPRSYTPAPVLTFTPAPAVSPAPTPAAETPTPGAPPFAGTATPPPPTPTPEPTQAPVGIIDLPLGVLSRLLPLAGATPTLTPPTVPFPTIPAPPVPTVGPAAQTLTGAKALKAGTLPRLAPLATNDNLRWAMTAIQRTLDAGLWVDGNHLDDHRGKAVFDGDIAAVSRLKAALRMTGQQALGPTAVGTVQSVVADLVNTDKLLASIALSDAAATPLSPKAKPIEVARRLAEAQRSFTQAATRKADAPEEIIADCREAWRKAQAAMAEATKK